MVLFHKIIDVQHGVN